ncbi:formimidoylglutamase [Halomonas saccharevitans]|uniref:Formimidoylglutamase n=1 Tax=Halomonas saccharevitans TaxID=416872 RepID=A0ABU3NE71_9GAMM|nr:formimidoylglutamase [Halomonas saccharevitans]MDT8879486.1 formimidoylglutamase [Halomonas saccharevitans]
MIQDQANDARIAPWQGRIDSEEAGNSRRWHQVVRPVAEAEQPGRALVGFCSDAGVARNKGRVGASEGPLAMRRQLANLAYHLEAPLFDAGDVVCEGDALEDAQQAFAERVTGLLDQGHRVIGLGGGHEIAFASFSGLFEHARRQARPPRIGILNLDAHLDLRNAERASSGTPFRQCAELCEREGVEFRYTCLGVSQTGNTEALFERAKALGVEWVLDDACRSIASPEVKGALDRLMARVDMVYLTICLDTLPGWIAPGVSAPAARGIELAFVEDVIDYLAARTALPMVDVAELNPSLDTESRTARVAARLVERLAR